MTSRITITQWKHHKLIDFKEVNESNATDYMDSLMELLLSGEKSVLCKNMSLSNEGFLSKLSESVERCYKEKHPHSLFSPELELHDPAGDGVYHFASLHRKWKFL